MNCQLTIPPKAALICLGPVARNTVSAASDIKCTHLRLWFQQCLHPCYVCHALTRKSHCALCLCALHLHSLLALCSSFPCLLLILQHKIVEISNLVKVFPMIHRCTIRSQKVKAQGDILPIINGRPNLMYRFPITRSQYYPSIHVHFDLSTLKVKITRSYFIIYFLFSKMEKYSWMKQENTEQGEPGSYERLRKPLHAYSLSNLIQWKRRNTHKKNIKH